MLRFRQRENMEWGVAKRSLVGDTGVEYQAQVVARCSTCCGRIQRMERCSLRGDVRLGLEVIPLEGSAETSLGVRVTTLGAGQVQAT